MALPRRKVVLPSSDGHPMTDKDINRLLMEYTEHAIATKFRHQSTGYVSANLFLYYDETEHTKCVSPDVFFVRNAPRGMRDNYVLWEEGFVPDVAFEFVARTSYRVDPERKRDIYELIGIPEYYVFDPLGKWLEPQLWAYRMEDGRYTTIPVTTGEYTSSCLGLRMRVEGQWLALYDVATGERMRTAEESELRGDREAERAAREAERARRLEQEVARLRKLAGPDSGDPIPQ